MIIEKFNGSDDSEKVKILKKLKEIGNPGSTFLMEPKVKWARASWSTLCPART